MAGVLDGIIKGGTAGASFGPEGAVIGAGLGLASGIIQNISANKSKNKADAAMPGLIDPRQAAFLSELNQKRKAIDTGADFGAGMNAINTANAATNNAIVKSTGGDVGGTIQGLLQSQQVADNGMNNILAQGQGQQMGYNSLFNDLNNKISARTLQLQMYDSLQNRAEYAQKKQTANQNTMTGGAAALQQLLGSTQPGSSSMGGVSETMAPNLTSPALPGTDVESMGLAGNGGKIDTSFLSYLK